MFVTRACISVVMTVFNGERWLRAALESVLAQTHGEFQFVIVDDGSVDASADVLAQYAGMDNRITVRRQRNQGQAVARNAGLALARGTYVAFMDADDELFPHRLAAQKTFLDAHERVACVGCGIETMDERGRRLGRITAPSGAARCRARLLAGKYYSMGASLMCRREAVAAVGGFRPLFRQRNDTDFMLRIAERYDIDNVRAELYRYRINLSSQSVTRLDEALWENKVIWDLHQERVKGGSDRLQRGEPVQSPYSNGYNGRKATMMEALAYLHLAEVDLALEEGRLAYAFASAARALWCAPRRRAMIRSLRDVLSQANMAVTRQ